MSQIKSVFFRNIEDNIAPVIYFHQLDPDVAAQEVREYVFTTRPAGQGHVVGGIHEQMVALLENIRTAILEGHKLPAAWISGFFGSGKSSFAKLLGLALDGMPLPEGKTMDAALLERDDTPKAQELRDAFQRLQDLVESMAVIFDIGTKSKNMENISHTIYREVMVKLGYSKYDGVAFYELALENEGLFGRFQELFREKNGAAWADKKDGMIAAQHFRTVFKALKPDQEELIDISTMSVASLTIRDMVDNLYTAIDRRAVGKTIFIVVDEVSQYIAKDANKMLDLQSFVAEIGGRASKGKSPLWLLVTGQEKLEEESKESVLFKLKDRFPDELRVHLDRANVREVVSRRLLRKKPGSGLESLVTDPVLDALKLHAYKCADVKADEVVEHYPLLPEHIPLFMDITQCIRNSSIKTQSDAGGVRSVLNNIWDLFNREPVALKNRPLGTLLTLDMLYDIVGSSIDSDVQMTLHKVFAKHGPETWESKVVKSIALLEMNAERDPVTPELLAALLYPQFGAAPVLAQVKAALEILKTENWIQLHEKNGWSIQNNAAQDWNRQKGEISVSPGRIQELLVEMQKELVSEVTYPAYLGAKFPLECSWGLDQLISGKSEATKVRVCFHWVGNAAKRGNKDEWIELSRQHDKMFHWVPAETAALESLVRELERSKRILERYKAQGALSPMYQHLVAAEYGEMERLATGIKKDLRKAWLEGALYFAGVASQPAETVSTFNDALKAEVEKQLEKLYHKFAQGHRPVTEAAYRQLLGESVGGLDKVFFDADGLGIVQSDAGKIVFKCAGAVPREILQHIEDNTYLNGEKLLQHFGGPPYGYSPVVVKACVIGLLRDERLRINGEITSIKDPGFRTVFEQMRDFNKAEIETLGEQAFGPEDRIAIRKLFEKQFGLDNVAADSDGLADLVFKHFGQWKDRVGEVMRRMSVLGCVPPAQVTDLNTAFNECIENRLVQKTMERVKRNLQVIQEGVARVKELESVLTDSTLAELRALRNVLDHEVAQLEQVEDRGPVQAACDTLRGQLASDAPWNGYADIKPAAEAIRVHYRAVRSRLQGLQQDTLVESQDELKVRPDFPALSQEQQSDVLQLVRKVCVDVDLQAVQPTLLGIQQQPSRIREATARAHQLVDQCVNETRQVEQPGAKPVRIHAVRLFLRNKIITCPEELDRALADLRERCMKELAAGATVRLEE